MTMAENFEYNTKYNIAGDNLFYSGKKAEALEQYRIGEKENDPACILNIGLYYLNDIYPIEKDIEKAKEYFDKALSIAGPAGIIYNALSCYYEEKENTTMALVYQRLSAEYKDIDGLHNMGTNYLLGRYGCCVNKPEAAKLYHEAVIEGLKNPNLRRRYKAAIASSAFNMAVMLERGDGISRDHNAAMAYFEIACDYEHPTALQIMNGY